MAAWPWTVMTTAGMAAYLTFILVRACTGLKPVDQSKPSFDASHPGIADFEPDHSDALRSRALPARCQIETTLEDTTLEKKFGHGNQPIAKQVPGLMC